MKEIEIRKHLWPAISEAVGDDELSIRVSGRCMEPYLEDQAHLTLQKARIYLPGDVVVVQRQSGPPVVHRLIGLFPSKKGVRFFTQADAAATPDSPVTREWIVGKICGGQCSPAVIDVPFRHRVKALHRFLMFLGTQLKRRLWPSLIPS